MAEFVLSVMLPLLRSGADKVVINTAAVERPGLIKTLLNTLKSMHGSVCGGKKITNNQWRFSPTMVGAFRKKCN